MPVATRSIEMSQEVTAAANGVALSIRLDRTPGGKADRYDLVYELAGTGPDPVTLDTPDELDIDIKIQSLATGEVAMDSAVITREAIASQPAGFQASQSKELSEDSGTARTLRFNLAPGRYVVTAQTLGPVVAIAPSEIAVP